MRDLYTNRDIMDAIPVITDREENKYTDIPGWEGEYTDYTEKAVLLRMPNTTIWFPFSQLRKAEDGQSIYASNWILEQKGI